MPKNVYYHAKSNAIEARIYRSGILYRQYFSLKQFKTRRLAEMEAFKWVKKTRDTLEPRQLSKLNTSGVTGVRLIEFTKVVNGNTFHHARWVSFWDCDAYQAGWSVGGYSDKGAFIRAYLSRTMRCRDRVKIEKAYERLTLQELKAIGKLKKRRV